jgi:hypothetical protein
MAAGGSITVGNHLFLSMALDNSGTAGVDPNCESITDPRGNVWKRIGKVTKSSGSANDGAHIEVWFTRVVVAYSNGDDITPFFSFPVARGAFSIREYSGVRPISYPIAGPYTATGNGTSITINGIPSDAGQLVFAVAAIETNTAITPDADTTGGPWGGTVISSVSNSGTDATSMTLAGQHKNVSSLSTQNWTMTKTGAADWAALAFVMDTYVNTAPTVTPGNPNYPCIAGPENLTNGAMVLPIDTGTAYMFKHKIFPNDLGSRDYAFVASVGVTASSETDPVSNHNIVGDLYLSGNETPTRDTVNTLTLFANSATLGAGATTWNPSSDTVGSGTALAALSAVGGECIRLEAGESVDVAFDPSLIAALFPTSRILRWGIRYIAFKDDGEVPGPTNGMNVYIYDDAVNDGAGGSYLVGGWLTNNYRGEAQYETRWFGELNGNPRAFREDPLTVGVLPDKACWTPADFANFGTDVYIQVEASVSDVFLDYIEAVVELAPERRIAHGGRTISTAPFNEGLYPTGSRITRMVTAADASAVWEVSDTSSEYVLVIREALPASPSDLYPAIVDMLGGERTVSPVEALGPALQLTAAIGPRETLSPYPAFRTGILSRGVLQEVPVESSVIQAASVTALDAINYPIEGSFFPSYYLSVESAGSASKVSASYTQNQYIVVPGAQQYTRIKVFVKRDVLTEDPLNITLEKPVGTSIAVASIEVADVDAAVDAGKGFKEVSVELFSAVTPTSGRVKVIFDSSTPDEAPWTLGGAIPPFIYAGYDTASPTNSTEPYDYSVVLECPLASPTYSLSSITQTVTVGSATCAYSATGLPQITLTNGGSYSHISIQRLVDGENSFPVALLNGPSDGQVFVDWEAPWDIPSGSITYLITGYRDSDHLSVSTTTTAWNFTSEALGAAFGLFSNELETGYAYVPVDERELVTEYSPLSSVQFVQRHGVDYQVALREPEERGVAVTVQVVIAEIAKICPGDTGSPTMGISPFDDLRALEYNRRMLLKLPGGETRYVYVKAGGMTVRTQRGTYMAEITLTDVEPLDLDPYA